MTDSRFMSFLLDLDVEVVDPVQLAAFDIRHAHENNDGTLTISGRERSRERMAVSAILELLSAAIVEAEAATGIRFEAAGGNGRERRGDVYLAEVLPAVPARRDDGTMPEFDSEAEMERSFEAKMRLREPEGGV